MKIISPH